MHNGKTSARGVARILWLAACLLGLLVGCAKEPPANTGEETQPKTEVIKKDGNEETKTTVPD
jgi:hypothetical protein